jgi:hypothetical protein
MQRNFRCSARKRKVKMRRSVFHDSTERHPQKNRSLRHLEVFECLTLTLAKCPPFLRLCDKDGTQTNMSPEKVFRSAITFSKNFLSVKTRDKTEYNPLIFSAKFLLLLHGKKIEN